MSHPDDYPIVENGIEQASNKIKHDNPQLLNRASESLTPEDYLYFDEVIGNLEGRVDHLYDVSGKALHTTNDFYFDKMLESGGVSTGSNKEGMYNSKGASFTDGDFSESLTFQTMFDDQNTHSTDKKFNSGKYSDKARDFVTYLWENQEGIKEYLSKISGGQKVDTLEDAIRIAEGFKFKARPKEITDDQNRLSQLFGVTICYKKKSLPDLVPKEDEGQASEFELLSHREKGVPLSEAETIFVPQAKIGETQQKLERHGLSHLDVRATEELEVLRMVKILSKVEGIKNNPDEIRSDEEIRKQSEQEVSDGIKINI